MTTDQANKFVAEVLRGLWGRWEPNDEEIRGWTDRLVRFEYGRAQKAVNDLFFETPNRVSPPANKVLAVLYHKAAIKRSTEQSEPVAIFSIIRERHFVDESKPNFVFAKDFSVPNKRAVPAREEIIHRAEATVRRIADYYGHRFIIIYPKLEGMDSPDDT